MRDPAVVSTDLTEVNDDQTRARADHKSSARISGKRRRSLLYCFLMTAPGGERVVERRDASRPSLASRLRSADRGNRYRERSSLRARHLFGPPRIPATLARIPAPRTPL